MQELVARFIRAVAGQIGPPRVPIHIIKTTNDRFNGSLCRNETATVSYNEVGRGSSAGLHMYAVDII